MKTNMIFMKLRKRNKLLGTKRGSTMAKKNPTMPADLWEDYAIGLQHMMVWVSTD
jgi:hypothetical protein